MSDLARFHRLLVTVLARTAPERFGTGCTIAEIRDTLLPYRLHRRALGVDSVEDYDALLLQLAAGDDALAECEDTAVAKLLKMERSGSNPDLLILRTHGTARLLLDPAQAEAALEAHRAARQAAPEAGAGDGATQEVPGDEDDALPLDLVRRSLSDAAAGRTAAASPRSGDANAAPAAAAGTLGFGTGVPIGGAPVAPGAMPVPIVPVMMPAAHAAPPMAPVAVPTATPAPTCACCGLALPVGRVVRFCPGCGTNQRPACPECGEETELGWRHCIACGAVLPDQG
jgi:hypothetical protein